MPPLGGLRRGEATRRRGQLFQPLRSAGHGYAFRPRTVTVQLTCRASGCWAYSAPGTVLHGVLPRRPWPSNRL